MLEKNDLVQGKSVVPAEFLPFYFGLYQMASPVENTKVKGKMSSAC